MNSDYLGNDSRNYEHRLVAERAIGKKLPTGAVIHHVNQDPKDNRPENLVILQSRAEHNQLHYRQKALDESGDADSVKCVYCKEWGPADSMYVRRRQKAGIEARHRACHTKYNRRFK